MESKRTAPNISPRADRRRKNCCSPFFYRKQNAIERMFFCLKGVRRIATRYHRRVTIFMLAVCILIIVNYWL